MSFIDMMTNSLLEFGGLVWTKRQTGQAAAKNSPFTLLYLGTTNVPIFPFSLARVFFRDFAQGISLFDEFISFHELYIKKFADSNAQTT